MLSTSFEQKPETPVDNTFASSAAQGNVDTSSDSRGYSVPIASLPDTFVENVWTGQSASSGQYIDSITCNNIGAEVLVCHEEEVCNEVVCASEEIIKEDLVEPIECQDIPYEGSCPVESNESNHQSVFNGTNEVLSGCNDLLSGVPRTQSNISNNNSLHVIDDNQSHSVLSDLTRSGPVKVKEEKPPAINADVIGVPTVIKQERRSSGDMKVNSVRIKDEKRYSSEDLKGGIPAKVKEEKRLSMEDVKFKTEPHLATSTDGEKQQHRRPSSSGSSSHKSSRRDSERKDHRPSSHHCSRCYKRSKIKRASIGVQCRRDKSVGKLILQEPLPPPSASTWHPAQRPSSISSISKPEQYTHPPPNLYRYSRYMHIETHPNGGASVVHMYQEELDQLSSDQMDELSDEFFKV